MKDLNAFGAELLNKVIAFFPNLISAILITIIGIYAIKMINKMLRRIMTKREIEPTLSNFLANILFWTLRVLLFVTVISQLGIGTSSFVAILGAAGLAVGLSLQGSLSNFSGGILIILFKPFKVNDIIEAQGVIGTVSEIQIFVTKIISANNQAIFIPNGALSNGVIINYTSQGLRRADLKISLPYNTNIKTAREVILDVMKNHIKVAENPEPIVVVKEFTETAVLLSLKPYTENAHFNQVCSDILEECKTKLDKEGIALDFSTN